MMRGSEGERKDLRWMKIIKKEARCNRWGIN